MDTNVYSETSPDENLPAVREEESLFARGDDDALVRYVKPTLQQFNQQVTVIIDGESIQVPKAKPQTDALGNFRRGPDGNLIPRATTIYDAAIALVDRKVFTPDELSQRIPVLCHLMHLDPVAVCRMCSVHISNIKRGKFAAGRKLVPACQHRVEDKMAVITRQGPNDIGEFLNRLTTQFDIKPDDLPKEQTVRDYTRTVQDSTRFIGELLSADHLQPDEKRGDRYRNELAAVAGIVGVPSAVRFSRNPGGPQGRNQNLHPKSRPIPLDVIEPTARSKNQEFRPSPAFPYASRSVHVDHDRCILCDRCARSCSDVKPFKVIGHTGKGYGSRISFDLDQLMDESSCVQCGECMTSCPTGALTLNRRVSPTSWGKRVHIAEDPAEALPEGFLTADELQQNVKLTYLDGGQLREFYPFRDMSFPFLRWNEGAVRRRRLKPGEILCKQGEFGSTAFLLVEGEFRGEQVIPATPDERDAGFWNWLRLGRGPTKKPGRAEFNISAERDLIIGEIACLTNDRRTATITAATNAEVLEITRNVLAVLQRSPSAQDARRDLSTSSHLDQPR